MDPEFAITLQEIPLHDLLLQGFAVLEEQNYKDQIVDILRGGFSRDVTWQKNPWSLVFLKHQQISHELVPFLVFRG
jgi:hypothetical protein